MSRFPKLTETFILFEVLALERRGISVEIYPLLRGRNTTQTAGAGIFRKLWEYLITEEGTEVMHPEAAPLVERANFQPFVSWRIMRTNCYFLWNKPREYLGTLWKLLRGTWGSLNFLLGGLSIFPKSVYFAHLMLRDGVTHIHGHFANHPSTSAFIISRLSGIPFSFTAHGSDLHRDRHFLREKVAEAAFVVAISDYNRQVILEECGEQSGDKVLVIHCGVDTDVFRPQADRKAVHRSGGPMSILCIGTLHEVKGQSYLIEACRSLRDGGVDFVLHFIGDGPDRSVLFRQVAGARLRHHVVFHGQKNRPDIARLLPTVDVVVSPSVPTSDGRREGIPVVLMEAMSSGVAVVASRISGIPELVDDEQNGLLVPPRDPQALAKALRRLHRDVDFRRRLGQGGREKVRREFNVDANVASLAGHFQNEWRRTIRQPPSEEIPGDSYERKTGEVGSCP